MHSRVRSADDGGPPPWIPFGKKIMKVIDQGKNFKALADKEKSTKENSEFEAQRKDAIAEAAKQGNKKIFGGGNQQASFLFKLNKTRIFNYKFNF